MKRLFYLILCVLASCLVTSCHSASSDIPYTVMEHYFQSNKVEQLPSATVTTAEEFQQLFGMASVMGEHGTPTPVDFEKEYVIAVSKPATDIETELVPVSLKRDSDGNIEFIYKTKTGDKVSYKMTPCLLIKVDNQYKGNVSLKELN